MPQMSPLNWLTLMIYFIIILILFSTLNFFSYMYNKKNKNFSKKTYLFNWKW